MSSWTLLRFFTARSTFDLVSQQVVVHQWLHGSVSSAHLGQTAYLPKMLLLYAPLDLLPGSPRLKLIVLTLLINIVTFVLLGLVVEQLLRAFRVRVGSAFYAALLWLSVLAGSVFWIEFANSRNLEVVGGVFWIYLGVCYLQKGGRKVAYALAAFGSLLFFSDPLQFYMSALPVLAYALILGFARYVNMARVVKLFGLTLVCFGVSRLLLVGVAHSLHASFSDTGNVAAPTITPAWLMQSGQGTVKAVLGLFAGAADAGKARELANLSLLSLGVATFVYTYVQRLIPRKLVVLLACWVFVDTLVYIASGQAAHGAATNRYLIMLAPAALIGFCTVRLPRRWCRPVAALFGLVIGLNLGTLGLTLQRHVNIHFPQDAQITSTYRYVRAHPTEHIYASTDTAMPLLYMYNLPAQASLPVGCLDGKLVATHYSMDRAFQRNREAPQAIAVIVLDGRQITNSPNVCTLPSIVLQLGRPLRIDHTDNHSLALLYPESAVHLGQ